MQKANDVMLWWQMLDWVEEVWRRLLDALGWLEFVMCQLVHHLALVANFSPPCFMTEGRFVGVIMDSYYQNGVDLAEEITKLGAPMWMASFTEHQKLTMADSSGLSSSKHPLSPHSMDGVLFCAGSLDGLWLIHDNYPSSIPLFYIVWDTLKNLT